MQNAGNLDRFFPHAVNNHEWQTDARDFARTRPGGTIPGLFRMRNTPGYSESRIIPGAACTSQMCARLLSLFDLAGAE